jgi:hypothetical protein
MHSQSRVEEAMALRQEGLGARRIAKRLSLPVSTVRDWLAGNLPAHSRRGDRAAPRRCDGCGLVVHEFELLTADYVYLLGLYLGDGCISRHRRSVYRLRIALDAKYPGIVDSAAGAMSAVCPGRVSRQLRPQNYVEVSSYWNAGRVSFLNTAPAESTSERSSSPIGSRHSLIGGRSSCCVD